MQNDEQLRENLIEMLEDLNSRLSKITHDVTHVDGPVSQDFAEQAVENENNEVLDALGEATRTDIAKIKQALLRMDKGEYGVCQACGESIGNERLAVIPFSSLCVKCATLVEGC
ncbi:MAG: TraR/DksA family transcriptional regulator [Methylococcales bacterium]|nr:TraR/DksA family transcriptional regulator [Methylococcales bacterium]